VLVVPYSSNIHHRPLIVTCYTPAGHWHRPWGDRRCGDAGRPLRAQEHLVAPCRPVRWSVHCENRNAFVLEIHGVLASRQGWVGRRTGWLGRGECHARWGVQKRCNKGLTTQDKSGSRAVRGDRGVSVSSPLHRLARGCAGNVVLDENLSTTVQESDTSSNGSVY
jgi:hypothetical protein